MIRDLLVYALTYAICAVFEVLDRLKPAPRRAS